MTDLKDELDRLHLRWHGEHILIAVECHEPQTVIERLRVGLSFALEWGIRGMSDNPAVLPDWLDAWFRSPGPEHWTQEEWLSWFEPDSERDWVVLAMFPLRELAIIICHVPSWPTPIGALEEIIRAAGGRCWVAGYDDDPAAKPTRHP